MRAHGLQKDRWLLHAAKRQRLAHLGGLGRPVPGLSEGDAHGGVWLRCQGSVPPHVLLLPHQPLPQWGNLHRRPEWIQVRGVSATVCKVLRLKKVGFAYVPRSFFYLVLFACLGSASKKCA